MKKITTLFVTGLAVTASTLVMGQGAYADDPGFVKRAPKHSAKHASKPAKNKGVTINYGALDKFATKAVEVPTDPELAEEFIKARAAIGGGNVSNVNRAPKVKGPNTTEYVEPDGVLVRQKSFSESSAANRNSIDFAPVESDVVEPASAGKLKRRFAGSRDPEIQSHSANQDVIFVKPQKVVTVGTIHPDSDVPSALKESAPGVDRRLDNQQMMDRFKQEVTEQSQGTEGSNWQDPGMQQSEEATQVFQPVPEKVVKPAKKAKAKKKVKKPSKPKKVAKPVVESPAEELVMPAEPSDAAVNTNTYIDNQPATTPPIVPPAAPAVLPPSSVVPAIVPPAIVPPAIVAPAISNEAPSVPAETPASQAPAPAGSAAQSALVEPTVMVPTVPAATDNPSEPSVAVPVQLELPIAKEPEIVVEKSGMVEKVKTWWRTRGAAKPVTPEPAALVPAETIEPNVTVSDVPVVPPGTVSEVPAVIAPDATSTNPAVAPLAPVQDTIVIQPVVPPSNPVPAQIPVTLGAPTVANTPSATLAALSTSPVKTSARDVVVTVGFKPDQVDLTSEDQQQFASTVGVLKAEPGKRINIISYATSSDSQSSTARRVSLKRALAVRKYIISQGIDSVRINVQAMGNSATDDSTRDRIDVLLVTQS